MKYVFWICWGGEFIAVLLWLIDEMRLVYLKPNPLVFVSFFYLFAVLIVRYPMGLLAVSNGMVLVPAIPLVLLLLVVLLATITGTKWN
jgi:hypothetical protein